RRALRQDDQECREELEDDQQPPAFHGQLSVARRGNIAAGLAFAGLTSAAVPAVAQTPDASVAEARLPRRPACGRTFRASVTMRNTGATTWTSADALAAERGEDPFTEEARVALPKGAEVAPGESHTFRFALTAPEIPLPSARTAWRMIDAEGTPF